MVETKTDDFRP